MCDGDEHEWNPYSIPYGLHMRKQSRARENARDDALAARDCSREAAVIEEAKRRCGIDADDRECDPYAIPSGFIATTIAIHLGKRIG